MKKILVEGIKNGTIYNIEVSNLILGGGDFVRFGGEDKVVEMLDDFYALGGNTVDTGRHYRESEKMLGNWMNSKGVREKFNVLTKACHPTRELPDTPRVNAFAIREDLEASLNDLNTDYIDLYALHRDDVNVSVKEIIDELNVHINAGKIRAIGTSNWSLERLIEANEYAKANGLRPFTFNSPNLSLARPTKPRWPGCVSADGTMEKWHLDNNFPMISWSSQAGGFFTGRFTKEDKSNEEMVECYYTDENWARFDVANEIASRKNVTAIEIALAYVINQKYPCAAVIGTRTKSELDSSYKGSLVNLTEEEMTKLDLGGK